MSLASAAVAAALLLAPGLGAVTVAVDAGATYQTITGFGAATAWNTINATEAQVLWSDDSAAPMSDTTAHANGHVGLSLVRTRIDPTGNFGPEEANMSVAVAVNPNLRVWSTEWSPPAQYKNNNNVNGNNQGAGNPATDTDSFNGTAANYAGYSGYQVNYVKNVKANTGVNLYALSVQNEPDWDPNYEACLWTAQNFDTYVGSYLGPAFKSAGFGTKIMVTESFGDNLSLAATTMDDPTAAPYVGIVAGHLYGDLSNSTYTGTFLNAKPISSGGFTQFTNQDYWETEISDVSGAGVDNSMQSALEEAYWVHTCIVDWGMNAFHHWWINATDNSGLVSGGAYTTYSDKLYALGNFSKFIRPGFRRIGATEFPVAGVSCSAYDTPARLVVVAINKNTGAVSQAFTVSGLNVASVVPWITDSGNGLAQQAAVAVNGGAFTYTLPAQSVVTFVGDCVTSPSPTATASASPTPSRTATGTPTGTPTRTPTDTPSGTPSPSRTDSPSPSASPSGSPTATATPTETATVALSATGTESRSATVSPTETLTGTASPTATASPTDTGSASRTASPMATASPTDTGSASRTASPTATASPTDTGSASRTASPTATASQSRTVSVTGTVSATPSPTRSGTLAGTASPSPTATPSAAPTAGSKATATATSLPGGALVILQAAPVPNPDPKSVAVDLEGPVDGVEGTLYTLAQAEVGRFEWLNQAPGWDRLPLPLNAGLSDGLYYLRLQARRGQARSAGVTVKVYLLRMR